MMEQYKQDKKNARVRLELVKTDVRKMIDEALTPQIRKFLPTLIKRLEDLNNFEAKLLQMYKDVDELRKNHEERMDRMR